MNREPAAIIGFIPAATSALIALVVAFGLDLSKDQTTAIVGLVAVVAPVVAGFVTRTQVTPVAGQHRAERGAVDLSGAVYVLLVVILVVVLLALLGLLPAR